MKHHTARTRLYRYGPLTVAALGLMACGGAEEATHLESQSSEIIGGVIDSTNRYKEVVRVASSFGACSGTLITEGHVLTAAHCVCPLSNNRRDASNCENHAVAVITARGVLPTGFAIGRVTVHPSFEQTFDDDGYVQTSQADLAIIELWQEQAGIDLPPLATSAPAVGDQVALVGYGYNSCENTGSGARRYGKTDLTHVTSEWIASDDDTQVHAWSGDSGGPAYASVNGTLTLAGVASVAVCGSASVYTNVATYHDWISDNAQ